MSEGGSTIINRALVPDLDPESLMTYPFYRPEPSNTLSRLETLRPSALYIFGETSPMSPTWARELKMKVTGTGLVGSGGAKEGRVKEVVLQDIGHLVAMEASGQCADATAAWLRQEMQRFAVEQEKYLEWTMKSLASKSTVSEEWQKRIGGPPLRSIKGKM
jgi:hypothetical protein